MPIHIAEGWILFCIAFGIVLITRFIMSLQARYFFTNDVVLRKFSMMDLQLPASSLEVVNLIRGIFLLPGERSKQTIRSLKGQLYVDFVFMPAAYGSVFLLCMKVSWKMSSLGHWIFAALAWLQVIAWLCDIIENFYLLQKIRPDVTASKPGMHKAYVLLEIMKWGIVSVGVVCSLYALFYFWLAGHYTRNSLYYVIIILAEAMAFIIALKIFRKKVAE